MALNIDEKQEGDLFTAEELNQIVQQTNDNEDEALKPSYAFFDGHFIVDGTVIYMGIAVPRIKINPAFVTAGGGSMTREQILTILGTIPLGNLPDGNLSTNQFEVLDDGTIGIKVSWLNSVINNVTPVSPTGGVVDDDADTWSFTLAAGYAVDQHETTLDNAITWTVNSSTTVNVGDVTIPAGYVQTRVKAASGRNPSAPLVSTVGFTNASDIVPPAPTAFVVDDAANTGNFTYATGFTSNSQYEQTLNGGTTITNLLAKPIVVGNVYKAVNQVGVRVKADTGRTASAWLYNTTEFTVSAITPPAPTGGVVNDTANTFVFTPATGYAATEHEYKINGGSYIACTTNTVPVGDVDAAIGAVLVRVKAAVGRNAGPTLANATAFNASVAESFSYVSNVLDSANMNISGAATGSYACTAYHAWARFKEYIPAGQNGVIKGISRGLDLSLTDNPITGEQDWSMGIARNSGNSRIEYFYGDSEGRLTPFDDSNVNAVLQIRFRTTDVVFSYSNDGGTTWLGNVSVPRVPAKDYYYYITNKYNYNDAATESVQVSGFEIDSALT